MMEAALDRCAPHTVWRGYLSDSTLCAVFKSATPAAFYSCRQILDNCCVYEAAVGARAANFRYAVKACPLAPVLRTIASAGWGADCQSVMEAELALEAGIAAQQISICSPRLDRRAVEFAVERQIILIADSVDQMELLAECLAQRCFTPSQSWHFGARLSLDVAATERFHTKLGMEVADVVRCLDRFPVLRAHFNEIHHHGLAREFKDTVSTAIAASMRCALATIEAHLEQPIRYINFGGGFEPESLLRSVHGVTTAELLAGVLASFDSLPSVPSITVAASGVPASTLHRQCGDRILVFEPGRAITKDASIIVTSVTNTKQLRGANIAVVDASTNLLIPLPLAEFSVALIDDPCTERQVWEIVDGTCSPAGVVARKASLPAIKPGAKLVVNNTGAYTWSLCEPFFDYLPQLWWIDCDLNFVSIFSPDSSRAWSRSVWGY